MISLEVRSSLVKIRPKYAFALSLSGITYSIRQKVHIILDGAGYHRAELVKEWAYVMNIDLHYLPPYSPNLNPIERVWKVMNEQVRNNRYFASPKVFRQKIHSFFRDILPELAGALSRRINDNFQMNRPGFIGADSFKVSNLTAELGFYN